MSNENTYPVDKIDFITYEFYYFDFDKTKTVEDIVLILKSMNLGFHKNSSNHEDYEAIKHFLKPKESS